MKCRTCARRLDIEKLDYTVGCKHEQMEGFVCLACAFEGVAYWMTNISEDDYCEEYVEKQVTGKLINVETPTKRESAEAEKQVKGDLISRQAAIDAIENTDWYHQNANKDMVSGANPDTHQAWYKAGDVYKALESVPSAQPEPRWIPCSERLPEMCENVLLYIPPREGIRQHGIRIGYCDEDNPIPEDEDGEHNFWGMKTYGGKWHVTGWGYYDEPIPIAWMPLPAPWEEGESNG